MSDEKKAPHSSGEYWSGVQYPKKLRTWKKKQSICPRCGETLSDGCTVIPGATRYMVHGKRCFSCGCIYIESSQKEKIISHLYENYKAHMFSLDDVFYGRYLETKEKAESAIWCEVLLHNEKVTRQIMIVTSEQYRDVGRNVYYYTDELALILLAAVALQEETVTLLGEEFFIDRIYYGPSEDQHLLSFSTGITVLEKNNGGYYNLDSSVKLVDGLVFAEKTHKLEVLKVSYSTKLDEYYVDPYRYDDFCKQYGLPYVRYRSKNRSRRKAYDYDWDLNPESVLHQLGYNVGKRDNLTEVKRQIILARCVNMGYMTVHDVIYLLRSLIQRNGGCSHQSVLKWKKDIEFISNYKVDADQMAFVSKIMRIR